MSSETLATVHTHASRFPRCSARMRRCRPGLRRTLRRIASAGRSWSITTTSMCLSMTPRERVERLQRLGRAVLERMYALRLSDELDESFYEALRESMIAEGATDGEIDALAQLFITSAVEGTEPGSEERLSQFELITEHLACTRVRICL